MTTGEGSAQLLKHMYGISENIWLVGPLSDTNQPDEIL